MIRLRLHQTCVYWARTGTDSFGKPSFASPVELICRWEDQASQTIDNKGDIVLSSARVYLSQTGILPQGVMILGLITMVSASGFNTSDPLANAGAHEIISVGNVPSLNAAQSLTTAMLR